jgi:phosphinothricin acetyltransferase
MMAERIRNVAAQYPWFVFEGDDQVLGFAYGSTHRSRPAYQWSVEVTVYLDRTAQRKGLGKALYVALLEALRRQGYIKAFAGITLPNPASVGLHEAMGFTRVGVFSGIGFKFGKWHDVLWLELQLREDSAPAPPLPIDAVLADPTLGEFLQQCAQQTAFA